MDGGHALILERNVLFLVEQACGPIDEAILLYHEGMDPVHSAKLMQARDMLEAIMTDFEHDPYNPDVVHNREASL